MSKKASLSKGLIGACVACLTSLVSVFMFFADFIVSKATIMGKTYTSSIKGFDVAFGFKGKLFEGLLEIEYKAAPLLLVGFILIALAVVVAIACVLPALAKQRRLVALVGALLLVVAAVFVFCSKANWFSANNIESADSVSLGAGAIVTGILCAVGALGFGGAAFLK